MRRKHLRHHSHAARAAHASRAADASRAVTPPAQIAAIARLLLATTLAIAFVFLSDVASAGPVGANPVTPGVTITQNGGVWTIVAPDGSIINYASFDILAGEIVNFMQGGPGARALNRISGDFGASMIFGTLTADGTLYFVNPAGVFFGNGAVVDVAGLYAAAGHISDADFVAHIDRFTGLAGEVTIAPQAQLAGTTLHLLGARVVNHGHIEANGGVLTMVAGSTVHLQPLGERVRVVVDGTAINDPGLPGAGTTAPSMTGMPGVENTGTVRNTGGQIVLGAGDLYSLAFRNTGTIEAQGGDVTIAATGGLVQNDGLVEARAVTVEGRSVLHRGTITAEDEAALAAHDHLLIGAGATVSGSDVRLESPNGLVAIASGAEIEATAAGPGAGDGSVLIDAGRLTLNGAVHADSFHLHGPFNVVIRPEGGDASFLSGIEIDFSLLSTDLFGNSHISFAALEAMTGSVLIDARGSIFIGETLDPALSLEFAHANDLTFHADQLISVRARIDGAGDLTLRADRDDDGFGWIELVREIDLLGEAIFEAPDIFVRSPSIAATGTQHWTGRTWLLNDTSIAGSPVFFHGPVNSLNGLPAHFALVLPGDVVFEGEVGGVRALRSLDVHGTALLAGGFVRTVEDQRYRGAATLGADNSLASIENGTIRFDDEVDGAFRLGIATGGLTSFGAAVGSQTALLALSTDDGGTTRLAGDVSAGAIIFADHVQLADDVTLDAAEYAMLRSTVNGRGFDLTIESPWTLFGGDATGFGSLRTDADGVTKIEASRLTGNRVELLDRVVIGDDTFISGTTGVEFGSAVDGAFDLHVRAAQGVARFGGDVGVMAPLESLRVEAGEPNDLGSNHVIFAGHHVRATGDIVLDPAGRTAPSTVATIAGLGDLTIESFAGDVFVGPNEKITALGDLDIRALSGTATLGDLNSPGGITVEASAIDVWAREGGLVLGADGVLREDTGADVIAGGAIFFSAAPGTRGTGMAPIYSSATGSFSTTLANATLRLTPVSSDDLTLGQLVLDLAAFLDVNDLAEAINDPEAPVRDRLLREPFILEAMERMAIYLRAMSDGEIRAATSGRQLFEDLPPTGVREDAPLRTVANRVRRESVVTVLDRYAGLFLQERTNLEGQVVIEDRSEEVRRALETAWRAYTRAEGSSANPVQLKIWLAEEGGHEEAEAYLDGLTNLATTMRTSGLTPRENRRSLDAILRPVSSGRFPQTSLELAIGVDEG